MATSTKTPTRTQKIAALTREFNELQPKTEAQKRKRKNLRILLWYYNNPTKRRAYLYSIGKARRLLPGMSPVKRRLTKSPKTK